MNLRRERRRCVLDVRRDAGVPKPQFWRCNNRRGRVPTEWVMFSIQKLLGRDEKFYDLLEASAQQADASVHHLIGLLQKLEQHDTPENLEQFAHSRREDKRITQELTEQLSKTFVTPFEREDIQELAAALYKIPKTVEKIGERILICPKIWPDKVLVSKLSCSIRQPKWC